MRRTNTATRSRQRPTPAFTLGGDPLPSWKEAKASLERWLLEHALAESGGNMAAAARRLDITKVAVLHAVRRHGLEPMTRRRAGASERS